MARWNRSGTRAEEGLYARLLAERERRYLDVVDRLGVDAPPAPTWPEGEPLEVYAYELPERPAGLHPNARVLVHPDDRLEVGSTPTTMEPAPVVDLGTRRRPR